MKSLVEYVGIPFRDKGRTLAGCDCWGLVRLILQREKGLVLPDYAGAYTTAGDKESVARAVAEGLQDWQKVENPVLFDLIILKVAGRPWHCALSLGEDRMLHALDGAGSVIERWTSPMWIRRVEGFYRHV